MSEQLTGRRRFREDSGALILQVEVLEQDGYSSEPEYGWRDACVQDLTVHAAEEAA